MCSAPPSENPLGLAGALTQFLAFFHKALRAELGKLHRAAADMLESDSGRRRPQIAEFRRRFEFLKLVYKYHSAAEDEVVYSVLDNHIKNGVCTFILEHNCIDEIFISVSDYLNALIKAEGCALQDQRTLNHRKLCSDLHDMCLSMHKVLCNHVNREEAELWPLFIEFFTIEEQEKLIGSMLGRMSAGILLKLIPWLMESLTFEEQQSMMALWRKATKNTMFHEWLGEWWEEMKVKDVAKVQEESNIVPSWREEPLEVLSTYIPNKFFDNKDQMENKKWDDFPQTNMDATGKMVSGNINHHYIACSSKQSTEVDKTNKDLANFSTEVDNRSQHAQNCESLDPKIQDHLPSMHQEELEATIRKISRDSTLDSQKKPHIIQSLLTSRWEISQEKSQSDVPVSSNEVEVSGQSPSYRDPLKLTLGCKHYKRNCKLIAACCNRLYPCRRCHDDINNHSMDRKATANMMCMKCLRIQPIGPSCSTSTCHNLYMAKYYCKICKLFDDERDIYHCPYCNLCRVGKGLGIDYFHCMNCNACMSKSLSVHTCREKCFEDNCPICHEFLFTSSFPVKALSCGHMLHSACFQDYTFTHYTCPICSKSLGDMRVYFAMLDALLAEEKIPDEYSGQTQRILCNDCEKRGTATFHWLYHKCSHCGSYNTRLL